MKIIASTELSRIIDGYLSRPIRHTITGLSGELSCSVRTIFNYRQGHYGNGKAYGAERHSHNRLFRNEDFQKIRQAANQIKAHGQQNQSIPARRVSHARN